MSWKNQYMNKQVKKYIKHAIRKSEVKINIYGNILRDTRRNSNKKKRMPSTGYIKMRTKTRRAWKDYVPRMDPN